MTMADPDGGRCSVTSLRQHPHSWRVCVCVHFHARLPAVFNQRDLDGHSPSLPLTPPCCPRFPFRRYALTTWEGLKVVTKRQVLLVMKDVGVVRGRLYQVRGGKGEGKGTEQEAGTGVYCGERLVWAGRQEDSPNRLFSAATDCVAKRPTVGTWGRLWD
jgi:hypothetical protein